MVLPLSDLCSLFSQLSVVAIIMNITRTAMVGLLLKGLLENHTTHPSFESLADLQVQFNNIAAIIVFFSWIKVSFLHFFYPLFFFTISPKLPGFKLSLILAAF